MSTDCGENLRFFGKASLFNQRRVHTITKCDKVFTDYFDFLSKVIWKSRCSKLQAN